MQPVLSARAAASEAGISASRWTQIVRGYKQETKDLRIPVRAPADTLARMATVVQASPEELDAVGRSDAADIMRAAIDRMDEALRQQPTHDSPAVTAISNAAETMPQASIEEAARELSGAVVRLLDETEKQPFLSPSDRQRIQTITDNIKAADLYLGKFLHNPEVQVEYGHRTQQAIEELHDIIFDALQPGAPAAHPTYRPTTLLPPQEFRPQRIEELLNALTSLIVNSTEHITDPLIRADAAEMAQDFIPAQVPSYLVAAYRASIGGIADSTRAIRTVTEAGEPIPAPHVNSLLFAVDDYVSNTRRIVEAMQLVDIDATRDQIDAATPLFAKSVEYADATSQFLDVLAPSAPNRQAGAELAARQQALGELAPFLDAARRTWSESGRSSESAAASEGDEDEQAREFVGSQLDQPIGAIGLKLFSDADEQVMADSTRALRELFQLLGTVDPSFDLSAELDELHRQHVPDHDESMVMFGIRRGEADLLKRAHDNMLAFIDAAERDNAVADAETATFRNMLTQVETYRRAYPLAGATTPGYRKRQPEQEEAHGEENQEQDAAPRSSKESLKGLTPTGSRRRRPGHAG
ncbi:hypothetical protein [Mycolicibacterium nivoides]|uniref:Uncharacterized protein n=2 Tax=Mycolicibacterium nivoides TaxID=2487344 RepID=A0ABW9LIZ1_9MYCO